MDMTDRTRSAATLAVLAVIFLIALAWAWNAVTEPFPEKVEAPVCTDQMIAAGEDLVPTDVTVSVLNASDRSGLAQQTMEHLVRRGFAEGDLGNASAAEATTAQVWTDDPEDPVAKLVGSYLGRRVEYVDQSSALPGVTVIVGNDFPGVTRGLRKLTVDDDTYACSP